MTTQTIEAQPAWYAGVQFRSRLEANWAETLDRLRIKWVYEPERVDLPSGVAYLPDFKLTQIGTWLEVKGDNIPRVEKARELAREVVCHCPDKAACTCPWPGGVIVLIGHPSLRTVGTRFGTMRWSDGLGVSAHLIKCENCSEYSWVRLRHSLECRRCLHQQKGGHLISSGELEFMRADRDISPTDFTFGIG